MMLFSVQKEQHEAAAGSCTGWQWFVRVSNKASQAMSAEAVAPNRVCSPQELEDVILLSSFCF